MGISSSGYLGLAFMLAPLLLGVIVLAGFIYTLLPNEIDDDEEETDSWKN